MADNIIQFPGDFLWGTAVCSHQAEGHNEHSDWWAWEQRGKIKDGTVSGPACDMYNRYPEDFQIMEDLGLGAFRLGVEWARIEPERGRYDSDAIQHYVDVLKEMKKHGLKVCLTLYHWVLPKWVADEGGWTSPDSVRWFRGFCHRVVDALFDDVDLWCTLNEPMCPLVAGYILGEFPPEKRNFFKARTVFKNLLKAHLEAYTLIRNRARQKDLAEEPLIGIAQALSYYEPRNPDNPLSAKFVEALDFIQNWSFTQAMETGRIPFPWGFNEGIPGLAGSFNYMGANYYTRTRLRVPDKFPTEIEDILYLPDGTETTEMGYEVYPPGFYNVLMQLSQYGVPIYVTENGIADETDRQRPSYILRHLAQVRRAMDDGADIRGYFHWSYIDNFEWKEGFSKHFGLVGVEPGTLDRKIRPSAYMYGDIAKTNRITEDMVKKYAPEAAREIWHPEQEE